VDPCDATAPSPSPPFFVFGKGLVSRIVDSLLFSGAAQPSDLEIHGHEYEVNQ
jgi:hypothetical protein